MDPVVRPATPADVGDLERLDLLARSGVADARGGALLLADCSGPFEWSRLLADARARVFVGTLDDAVAGFLVLRLAADRNRGVIEAVFVEEGGRELGLGDTLVEHAIAAIREAGLAGIEATALPGDRETKNLYERAGITARAITVYKSLR